MTRESWVQLFALAEVRLISPSVAAVLGDCFERLAAIRKLHAPRDGAESPFCEECGYPWPCATIRTLDDPHA
jgi:hypothetical protein